MGSNDKSSKEPDHGNATEQRTSATCRRIQPREGPGNPERDRLMAADKGLSTWEEMSEEMKQVSLGGVTFARMRENDNYYVDKSLLIKDILGSDPTGVYLFTRPRRFGKTTNLSMLDAFFNIKYRGNTWFDGLAISEHPEYEKFKNAFPVIHVDLGNAEADTYGSFLSGTRLALSIAFMEHSYLKDWSETPESVKELFSTLDLNTAPEDDVISSVNKLASALAKYHGRNPVILIDEYDRAVSDNFGEESHRPMMSFLSRFMYASVKGNPFKQMVYVTGVMQIAQQSIFSGLNNVYVNNIFSDESDERFGFTESEVKEILEYYGYPDKLDEVREWYDGYRFGNTDVYNPYSIMTCIRKRLKPGTYWANTGGDGIVRHLLQRINSENLDKILDLVAGNSTQAKLEQQFTYSDVYASDESLFSLMAMTGYLNAVPIGDDIYEISIPNKEVMKIVRNIAENTRPINSADFVAFNRAVLDGDAERIVKVLEKILITASYMDLNPSTPENPYEMVVATLLIGVCERYTVRTQREADLGRSDIIMFPKAEGDVGMVFELKTVGSEDEMDAGVEEAMDQIHEKRYYNEMPGKDVVILGICFWSKLAKARTEIVRVPAL